MLACSKRPCVSLLLPIWCLIVGCMIEFSAALSFGARGGRPSIVASTLSLDHGANGHVMSCRKLATGFISPRMKRNQQTRIFPLYSISRTQQEEAVDRLMQNVEILKTDEESLDESSASKIEETIKCTVDEMDKIYASCNDNYSDDDAENIDRFEPALGLYDVSHVQTARKGDNPVGGKWTRKNKLAQQLFSTRRTFQHLIPTNSTGLGLHTRARRPVVAECVNVISLDAFFKLLRLNVILRGDAVPLTVDERASPKLVGKLSNLAVRAFFDPPRIILGKGKWLNLELGPNTSVVLDTTYVDDRVRIGKGGTSGTKFVFFRCGKGDDEQDAMEFKALLQTRKMRTSKVLAVIGAFGASGVGASLWRGSKVTAGLIGIMTTLAALGISSSTGGVEDDGMDGDVLDSDDNEKESKSSIS